MYKKIITGSIVVLTWGISALFAADGEMTAAEMQALWHGHHAIKMVAQDPNAEANLKVAEEAKMRVAATKPKVAIQRLKDVHEKLGTGSSFLACIQEIETLLGPDHRSLAEKLRALLGIVGDQKALLVILEDFRTCLGGVGTLGDRIQIILKIIGTPQHADPDLRNLSGIVIPELYRVLARLGFGESMHATIDRAIQCVGGVEVTVFGNIAGVKKLVGGSGTLVERVQTLYALIPGGGTLLEQVQKMLVSNKQLQVDFDEKKKLLTASMSRVSVLEDDVIELQSKITASAQQVAALEKIITEKEAALKAQEETLDATRKILEEKEAVLKTLEAEKEAWDEDSETYEQHVQQLTAEKAALAQQISEKEAALRKATEEKDALEEKLKVAEESVARLTKEVRTEKARADSFLC
ncbi:MAG: hypothetical protein H6925_05105 [Holosporaceae bacterium]|nr:MAG: hypothetical protein H6925_05105 [Holosporaceae bacterium]